MENKKKTDRILIVDDTPSNIRVLGEALSEYDCVVATDGIQGLLKALQSPPPDLVLLDIMMPDMDGFEVCSRLKADPRSADIPVVFVTALGDEYDEKKGFAVGGVDYIVKPIRPAIVRARVRSHLELAKARRALERQNIDLREAAKLREDVEQMTRHDLKNPLASIIGMAELIDLNKSLPEDIRSHVKGIKHAADQVLTMINTSFDVFKMERGMYRLTPTEVDLAAVIEQILSRKVSSLRRCELEVDILDERGQKASEKHYLATGESLLTRMIFENLINNAIDASPKRAKITITLSRTEAGALRVTIHNKGAVPMEIRDRFFEKYVTHGKKTGMGMGTYSAKLMADAQGGTISMNSSGESGTTLTVELPSFSTSEDPREGLQ